MGFLSDVYTTAADEVGKIQIIADGSVSDTLFSVEMSVHYAIFS